MCLANSSVTKATCPRHCAMVSEMVGVEFITSIQRNMKPQLLPLDDKLLLKRRSIIEFIGSIPPISYGVMAQ